MSAYTSFDEMNENQEDTKVESDAVSDPVAPKKQDTMKALVFNAFGEIKDVVQQRRIPIPTIERDNDVLVKVLYASMNPVDFKVIKGDLSTVMPRKPNNVTGCDFCGQVVAKGKGDRVRFLDVGEVVFGMQLVGNGTFAEYTVIPASKLAKKPSNIGAMEAAAMPLVCLTAFQSMAMMKVQPSSKLLILGGSTAVGVVAIQIAKNHFNCDEVAVTSSREALCMELGASSVVNYKEEQWAEVYKDHGFDAILDCVGGIESWDRCKSEGVLKEKGHFVTIVGDVEHGAKMDASFMMSMVGRVINRKFWNLLGEQNWDFLAVDASKNMDDVAALIRDGKVKAVLDEDSPFEFVEWAKMFEKQQAMKAKGKLVVRVHGGDGDGDGDGGGDGQQHDHEHNMDTATVSKVVEPAAVIEEDTKMEEEPVADAEPAEDVKAADDGVEKVGDDGAGADDDGAGAGDDGAGADDAKVEPEAPAPAEENEVVAEDQAKQEDDVMAADDGVDKVGDDEAGADDAKVEPEAAAPAEENEEEQQVVAEDDNAETAAVVDPEKNE